MLYYVYNTGGAPGSYPACQHSLCPCHQQWLRLSVGLEEHTLTGLPAELPGVSLSQQCSQHSGPAQQGNM
jgi:hypothetical protein